MRESYAILETVEAYLTGHMDPRERKLFLMIMKGNPEIRQWCEIMDILIRAIQTTASTTSIETKVENLEEPF